MYEDDDELANITSGIMGPQGTPQAATPGPVATPFQSPPGVGAGAPMAPMAGGAQQQPNALAQAGGNITDAILGGQGGQTPAQTPQPGSNITDAFKQPGATPAGQVKTPGATERIASYRDQVSRLASTTDPAERARTQDSLARSMYRDMQAAGHDVKWEGDTMVIDGRRYTVGGAQPGLTTPGGIELPNDFPGLGDGGLVDTEAGAAMTGALGAPPPGFDKGKWGNPDHNTAKYEVTEGLIRSGVQEQLRAIPDEAGRKAFMEQTIRGMADTFAAAGAELLDVRGEKALISTADMGPHWVDMVQDIEGGATIQWHVPQEGGTGPVTGPGLLGIDSPGADGVPIGGGPGGAPGGQPGAAPGADPGIPAWLAGDTYTPGEIGMDDIPDLDVDALVGRMGDFNAERHEVGDLDVGPVEGDEEAIVRSILGNPESLNEQAIARMKVGHREAAAQREQQDLDELTNQAFAGGFAGSPWVASQRLGRRSATNEEIARGDREVDIEAARTNTADRRAAAGVGSAYLSERGARQRGNEALRQSATGLNNQNAFNEASLRSNNVANAAKLSLDAAAQRGNRMALRESVNQAAAELGISRDKLMLDYVTSQRDDMTRRYGIDVDAALRREGIAVDWGTLHQRGAEFQQELAFKMRQIALQYETDMSGIGLGYAQLDQRAYETDLNATMDAVYG